MRFVVGSTAVLAQQRDLPRATVTCVDVDDKPVADVEVHVCQGKGIPGPAS